MTYCPPTTAAQIEARQRSARIVFVFVCAAAIAALLLRAATAQAKDVILTFNDQEQQALVQVLDGATRSGGLAATQGTLYFYNKLQAAINAPSAPAPPAAPASAEPGEPAK